MAHALALPAVAPRSLADFLNMEACWDQLTGKNCRPYGNTNAMVHQQVLLDLGGGDSCTGPTSGGCPPFHIEATGEKVPKSDAKR